LVFVDPSPNNLYISEERKEVEVRLIDMDNVRATTSAGKTLYTPGYGAPEIVRQSGAASTLSDAHAFAVMAFEVLCLVHPLMGDHVVYGEPELEGRALEGRLPWIDHGSDELNRSTAGIPRELVLSPGLLKDFRSAFEQGLDDPAKRPGLATWAEHLHRAADRTLICPSCGGSYYYRSLEGGRQETCPWPGCGAKRPSCIVVFAMLWDPERRVADASRGVTEKAGLVTGPGRKRKAVDAVVVSDGEVVDLTERITMGTSGIHPRMRVSMKGGRVLVQNLPGGDGYLESVDGKTRRELGERPIPLSTENIHATWYVHTGQPDRLHRVLGFASFPRASR